MLDSTTEDSRIGSILNDRYRITDRIAAGGMGVVYKGERIELGRPVAIKFLQEGLVSNKKFLARFEGEARAMSKLNHPYCVPVIDFGVEGAPYIVMDYVTGRTLKTVMAKERLSVARAFQLARQLLAAIAHAHGHGIVHRDIKPDNIMLCQATGVGEHVRIFDFGLAKLLDDSQQNGQSTTSVVVGTPNYMSPEQTRGVRVDERTDIYSTGVVMYEMLAWRKPFIEDDILEILRMHREASPPPIRQANPEADISDELEATIFTAMAKDPEDRFQTPGEFIEALDATPEGMVFAEFTDLQSGRGASLRVSTIRRSSHPTPHSFSGAGSAHGSDSGSPLFQSSKSGSVSTHKSKAIEPVRFSSSSKKLVTVLVILFIAAAAAVGWYYVGNKALTPLRLIPNDNASQRSKDGTWIDVGIQPAEKIDKNGKEQPAAPVESKGNSKKSEPEPKSEPTSEEFTENLNEIKELAQSGELAPAIARVKNMITESPKNAHLAFVLGQLYYRRLWWSDSLAQFETAIRLDPTYRDRENLVNNVITMLGNSKVKNKARAILKGQVGESAVPYLKRASEEHPNPKVRRQARILLATMVK